MEDPISELDAAKHLMGMAMAEMSNTAVKATVTLGPFSAFTIISCLQYAQRKDPGRDSMFTAITGQLIEQLSVMFSEDGTTRRILAMGSDSRYDVTAAEANQRVNVTAEQMMNDPEILTLAAQWDAHRHQHDHEHQDHEVVPSHVYAAPSVTEMEATLAVANVLGMDPGQLIGFIVLGFDGGRTPKLMSNGDKARVIHALENCLMALKGQEVGEPTAHPNDGGFSAGQFMYIAKDGTETLLCCPLCSTDNWLAGTLRDGEAAITCAKCGVTLNKQQLNDLLEAHEAQLKETGPADDQS